MKLYAVTEYYYDFCNTWETIDSYWLSEEKAYEKLLVIQAVYEDRGYNPDTEWVVINEIETED